MSGRDDTRRLRQGPTAIRDFLDQLDESATSGTAANARIFDRHQYRTEPIVVELAQRGTDWIRYEAPPRNLSRGGIAFLVGHFVYSGTACRIHLLDRRKRKHVIDGVVVRCRYLESSGTMYEVGIKFAKQIEVEAFSHNATRLRFLMVDDDPAMQRLVGHLLKLLDVELTGAEDGQQALEMAATSKFDLILLDLELPGMDGFETARRLRDRGFNEPIAALSALTDDGVRERCLEAGCNAYLAKPVTVDDLAGLIDSLKRESLASSLAGDREMSPLISAFVSELPARLEKLDECFNRQDYGALTRLVRELKGDGGGYGFQPITDTAARVEQAVNENLDKSEIRSRLDDLVHVCSSASATP